MAHASNTAKVNDHDCNLRRMQKKGQNTMGIPKNARTPLLRQMRQQCS